MLLAAVYKCPQNMERHRHHNALFLTNKIILVGDPKAKHQLWNSEVLNPSGLKLLELFVSSNLESSAPHYTSDGRDDVPDIVVHQDVRLSEVTVTDQLPIMFSI
jgi:hypothetical protein